MDDFLKKEDNKKKEEKIKYEIDSLKYRYHRIMFLFKESEEKWEITHQPTKQWLYHLKLYSAEVEDLFEEYDYEIICLRMKQRLYNVKEYKNKLRRKDNSPSRTNQNSLDREMNDEMSVGKHNLGTTSNSFSETFIEYMLSRLEELQKTYDDICNKREEDLVKRAKQDVFGPKTKDILNLEKYDGMEVTPWRKSSVPFEDETNIYGRDYDEKILLEKLLESHEQVIALVGLGGLGKTTLAQKLYRSKYIECHFEKKIWVCVSGDFDVKKITQDSLDSVKKKKISLNVFSVIQEKLQKELEGKIFLLVLDDVWNENQFQWECLGFLSNLGSKGSKILITTRSRLVAEAIYPTMNYLIYNLKKLNYNTSLKLFQSLAFHGLDRKKKQELMSMSKDIVKRCNGLPLMISVVGKLLHDTNGDKAKWRSIIESDAWKIKVILNTYKISFDHLSYQLKKCFLYCSVFPKGHLFERGELAKLWIAQGLVDDGESKPITEIEAECVDGLMHRSFLFRQKDHLGEVKYVMHDIMHDLANLVLHEEQSWASTGLHLSSEIHSDDNSDKICVGTSGCIEPIVGRTFHHSMYPKPKELKLLPLNVELKHLRVMICDASYFDTISELVGEFKHLRYLNLVGGITILPKVICKLYNLHTLIFQIEVYRNISNFELPRDIGNLKKLQHMYVNYTSHCDGMDLTPGIGELHNLQTLTPIIKVKRYGEYCTLSELGNLSCLGGSLAITELENVDTIEEAKSARLEQKKNIKSLEFRWNVSGNFNYEVSDLFKYSSNLQISQYFKHVRFEINDENLKQRYTDVLNNLLPNQSLGKLKIYGYYGNQFPSWMTNGSLANLTVLALSQCSCQILPTLGKIPTLKDLTINFFGNLQQVGEEIYDRKNPESSFISLEKLKFYNLWSWKQWHLVDKCHFNSMRELYLRHCPNLQLLNAPQMFCKLEILAVSGSPYIKQLCRQHANTSLSKVKQLVLDDATYYR